MARAWRQYAVLILLLAVCSLYEAGNLTFVFGALRQPKAFPSKPFEVSGATRRIGTGSSECSSGGLGGVSVNAAPRSEANQIVPRESSKTL